MAFPTFLIKVLYAVYQVTPPCPQLDPPILTDIKELWGLHTGKRAVEALTAEEEVRCRVRHKPSETGVHRECQKRKFSCTGFPDHPEELPPLRPPPPHQHDNAIKQSIARGWQNLYLCKLSLPLELWHRWTSPKTSSYGRIVTQTPTQTHSPHSPTPHKQQSPFHRTQPTHPRMHAPPKREDSQQTAQ